MCLLTFTVAGLMKFPVQFLAESMLRICSSPHFYYHPSISHQTLYPWDLYNPSTACTVDGQSRRPET